MKQMVHTVTWKLRSCPRCGGDIYIDRDWHVWYEQCLQCGYLNDMPDEVKVHQQSGDNEKNEWISLQS